MRRYRPTDPHVTDRVVGVDNAGRVWDVSPEGEVTRNTTTLSADQLSDFVANGSWSELPPRAPAADAPQSDFMATALKIGEHVVEKNKAYGDSAAKTAALMQVLYPHGIPVAAYADALLVVRMLDKLSRLAAGCRGAFHEDAWLDLAGYGLIGAVRNSPR